MAQPAPPAGMRPSLAARWRDWRNRLVQNQHFQRLSLAFPLTRPVARRHARRLFDLVAGFVYSQALAAAVELQVLERVAAGPRSAEALRRDLELPPEGFTALLQALSALELLEERGDGIGLGFLGAALLANGGVREMIAHHRMLYRDLAEPVALLRQPRGGAALSQFWAYCGASAPGQAPAEAVQGYSALMAASQPMVAAQALAAVSLAGRLTLLDVGGGEGAFLAAAGARWPHLQLQLFDLPAVCARAEVRLQGLGLASRVRLHGGDFLQDALPAGADVISLVRILHDHDDEAVLALLRAVRAALPAKGMLLIVEPMAEAPGAASVGAYFSLYLHAMGRGRPRTPAQLRGLLQQAGFRRFRLRPTPLPLAAQVLTAQI